jgi:phospholipid transport system substrate-binding protein
MGATPLPESAHLENQPPMTRHPLALVCALFLSIAAGASMPVRADDATPAMALVKSTATEVINRLHADPSATSANPQRLYAIAEEVVLPHFDFERMSQRVLGKHWRSASPDQRRRFVGEFKTLLVRTYATAVSDYRDARLSFQPARALGTDIWRVRSNVDRGNGAPPLQIDYDVYRSAEAWKVFDVAINGVSLVVSYRSGFNTDIAKLGMDGLIDQIARHNVQKASGT